jgi:hypothetical protein
LKSVESNFRLISDRAALFEERPPTEKYGPAGNGEGIEFVINEELREELSKPT